MTPEFAYFLKVNVAFVLFTPSTVCSFTKIRSLNCVGFHSLLSLDWHCFTRC